MKKKLYAVLLALGVIFTVGAQEQSFSLQEAVDYALTNNKSLQATRFDVASAESAHKEVRAGWMPQVEASIDYMTYFGYEMAFSFGSTDYSFTDEQMTDAYTAAYAASDGQFDVAQYAGSQAFESSLESNIPATTIDMSDQSTAKLQVGQVIFNGQLLVGIRAAKLGMALAEKSVENSELDTKALVTSAYYNVLVTEKTLSIVELNLQDMTALLKKTQALYDAGMVELTDVDQLRVQLNTLKNTKLSMERTVQITYNLLRFHLGLQVNDPIVLTDPLESFLGEDNVLAESGKVLDLNNNINYQLMETQVELSEEMVENEKWAFAPTISAFYAYNAKILTSGFDTNPNHMAGATMTIPVFSSGARKHKLEQAQIDLDKNKANQDLLKDQLYLEEVQLRFDFQSKYEQYLNQKENVEVAKRVYKSYENKFEQGVASSMDLTQANSNYLKAESDYLTCMLDLLQAKVAFDKLLNIM